MREPTAKAVGTISSSQILLFVSLLDIVGLRINDFLSTVPLMPKSIGFRKPHALREKINKGNNK